MTRDDDFYTPEKETKQTRRPAAAVREEEGFDDDLDSRAVDLAAEDASRFLRGQRRVPVRRGALPRKTANRLKQTALAALALAVAGGALAAFYFYGTSSWRFRIDSSDDLEVTGTENVAHAQVLEIMGGDIGRNIFFVSLSERKRQLEEIPWVESATVMRLLPNRLKIDLRERAPVAFARIGSKVLLMDASGVLLEPPPHSSKRYSFPVITGLDENEPLSTRAASMKIYLRLVRELDSEGARYSNAISEVDLSDPDDVKITIADVQGAVLVHLGDGQFLDRYKIYLAHVQEWRQQFSKVESVDLRYDRQVIVNPDPAKAGTETAPQSSQPATVKKASIRKRHTK